MPVRRPSRAFSLIELLVAISIIAVLMGIVLPMLPKARDAAKRAACGANLHGVGQAMQIYTDANRGEFPRARYMPPPWLSGDTDPPLDSFLKETIEPQTEAWRCPGDRVVFEKEYPDAAGVTKKCGMSYTYVISLGGRPYEQTFFYRFLRQTPSDTPVSYDFDGGTFETQSGEMVPVPFFHESRQVLFVDGHVGKYGQ